MSEQALWDIAWLVVGFGIGLFACSRYYAKKIEESFDAGFRLGRAFDGFDGWFRENFGERYAD